MDKWATSKSTTKVWVKLLLLFENTLKLNFEVVLGDTKYHVSIQSRVARPYSAPRERVWNTAIEQLVAQEFN